MRRICDWKPLPVPHGDVVILERVLNIQCSTPSSKITRYRVPAYDGLNESSRYTSPSFIELHSNRRFQHVDIDTQYSIHINLELELSRLHLHSRHWQSQFHFLPALAGPVSMYSKYINFSTVVCYNYYRLNELNELSEISRDVTVASCNIGGMMTNW